MVNVKGTITSTIQYLTIAGEKCTKYFLQLETRNFKTKCIKTLTTENKTIRDQQDILKAQESFTVNCTKPLTVRIPVQILISAPSSIQNQIH